MTNKIKKYIIFENDIQTSFQDVDHNDYKAHLYFLPITITT